MRTTRRALPMIVLLMLAVGGCSGAFDTPTTTVTPTAPVSTTSAPASVDPTTTDAEPADAADAAQSQPAADTSDDSIPIPARGSTGTVDVSDYAIDEFETSFAFLSPTGNIGCSFFAGGSSIGEVGCQAGDSVNPVDGRTCTDAANNKFAVRINDGGAQHLCTNQGIYYGNSKTLPYGQTIVRDDVSCTSAEQTGITCYTDDGGFTLSRNINRIY